MINTGVKRKKRSELGIALSSVRRFEAREKTGDRIKDGVRNGIKEGRDFTLGIRESCELPSAATLSFSS